MNPFNLHILTPNKNKNRYFGVDYFLNIVNGHNPLFQYYSTPLDANPVYQAGPTIYLSQMVDLLRVELSGKDAGSVIGIQNNPDIYSGMISMNPILSALKDFKMGVYLETTSERILNDIDALVDFAKELPLMIAVPVGTVSLKSQLLGENLFVDPNVKLIQKLKNHGLKVGMLVKPVIPYINDDLDDFTQIIQKGIDHGVDFIYPSFSIKFDSKKIKAFYDIIDMEFPELMVKFRDEFGLKNTWESPNVPELKKHFVILCRKHKVLYAMKDIVNYYKPDLNIQLKLF